MEHVHDNVDKIQEHPPSLRHSFHVNDRATRGLHFFQDLLGNAANVCVGRAARDDEVISHVGHSVQVEHHDVVCLDVEARCNSLSCERLVLMGGRDVRETFVLQVRR